MTGVKYISKEMTGWDCWEERGENWVSTEAMTKLTKSVAMTKSEAISQREVISQLQSSGQR